jgi:hypothetical protein
MNDRTPPFALKEGLKVHCGPAMGMRQTWKNMAIPFLMQKHVWAVSVFLLGLALGLVGVAVLQNRPVTVLCQVPTPCAQVSPFGAVTFEFSRPVRSDLVELAWQIDPPAAGRWEWLDERHARWKSTAPLPADRKLTLGFAPGPLGQNGERLGVAASWQVSVRAPRIAALVEKDGGPDLFTYALDGQSAAVQLSHTNGRIYDYQVSPDGETAAFSVYNERGGIDLWTVQRDGSGERLLLDCGADRCTTPAWSVSLELAYTRESAESDAEGTWGAPRVWILDLRSGQTAPLFADPRQTGFGPKWSPDGQRLSIWNGLAGEIEVVKRASGETFGLKSAANDIAPRGGEGSAGSWTADSLSLYYAETVAGETSFLNLVLRADVRKGTAVTVFGGSALGGGLSVSGPVPSPADGAVAVTLQENVRIPGKKLALLLPGSQGEISISDDLSRIPGFYSWTPDGRLLVYQAYVLGGSENDTEIWAWDRAAAKADLITIGGRLPQWLP